MENQTNENTGAQTAESATAETQENAKKFTVKDLDKKYFAPSDVGTAGNSYVAQVATLGLDIRTNFDPEAAFPENFGLYVIPLQRRADEKKGEKKEDGNITIGVAVCAVPSLELVSSDERGHEFIQTAVNREYEKKIIASIRPRSDGKLPAESAMPKSLDDFLENRRETTTYGVFSELAKKYVPELKKQGLVWITPVVLRQCLQSKAYAASFPAVKDAFWVKLLDVMIAKGNAMKGDVSVLENWKATRDEATIDVAADIDLDAISSLID